MKAFLLVALGGAVGASARHAVSTFALRVFGPGWPHGTFMVNVAGGLLMGVLAGWLTHRGGASAQDTRLLLATGVLGGFTTFSAFSLELSVMLSRRDLMPALAYASVSVLGALAACFAGLALARRVWA